MDREADVIRSEMSETRAELDRKLTLLESRARELTPREYAKRHLPEYWAEQVIGTTLTFVGAIMAWNAYRHLPPRRLRAGFRAPGSY
jgi:hypothetical protein